MAKVSICVPTYNYGRFIGTVIQSVLEQSYKDFEIVICDNCSTDNTRQVVSSFKDSRIKYFLNEKNIGMYNNFNRTIKYARGEFLKFFCADDWLHPRYLEEAVGIFESYPNLGIVGSSHYGVEDETGRILSIRLSPFGRREMIPKQQALHAFTKYGNIVATPTQVIVRRSALDEVGIFDPDYEPGCDMHLWMRILTRWDLGWLVEPRSYNRIHPHQSSWLWEFTDEGFNCNFKIWLDLNKWFPSRITEDLVREGLYTYSCRQLLNAFLLFIRGRFREGGWISARVFKNNSFLGVMPRFVAEFPLFLWFEIVRKLAPAIGRSVLYSPHPHFGPKMAVIPIEVNEIKAGMQRDSK